MFIKLTRYKKERLVKYRNQAKQINFEQTRLNFKRILILYVRSAQRMLINDRLNEYML